MLGVGMRKLAIAWSSKVQYPNIAALSQNAGPPQINYQHHLEVDLRYLVQDNIGDSLQLILQRSRAFFAVLAFFQPAAHSFQILLEIISLGLQQPKEGTIYYVLSAPKKVSFIYLETGSAWVRAC